MTRNLIVALSGGIGGAKLALGLSRILPPEDLLVVANVGDDFEHLGLHVSPDIDTLLYTLAGLDNRTQGWGRADESWHFMETLRALGGADWFALGDRDLAVHVERTHRLRQGQSLSQITADFARRLGVAPRVLPVTDDPVRTRLQTASGWLAFQEYFVHQRCAPVVQSFAYDGAAQARPQAAVMAALRDPRLRAVVICPSNPYLSIDPMLAIPAFRAALAQCAAPVIAVSPIIGGRAVKGPTAKLMHELGLDPSSQAIGAHYGDLLDILVIDPVDETGTALGVQMVVAPTLMKTLADREALARVVLGAV
jgi:LPPG:FO 2-phospho-L-lactate transferase